MARNRTDLLVEKYLFLAKINPTTITRRITISLTMKISELTLAVSVKLN